MAKKFTLLGCPLKHSMSPQIHARLFEILGISAEYSLTEIPPESLAENISLLKTFDGFNVTIPHKIAIIPFLDRLDETAKRYGAVNCVKNENGRLIGYNTDCIGFLRGLSSGGASLGGKVLLLGCGGAGRMMAAEAILHDCDLTVAVREGSLQKTDEVISLLKNLKNSSAARVVDSDKIDGDFDILLNSTPVGMYPKTGVSPTTDEVISRCKFVFDAVYNPEKTELLRRAEMLGKRTIGGMSMLVFQAA
ncbi:MAG: shikimate dehydrogenase, partial [Oscillospiraceae bacterium]